MFKKNIVIIILTFCIGSCKKKDSTAAPETPISTAITSNFIKDSIGVHSITSKTYDFTEKNIILKICYQSSKFYMSNTLIKIYFPANSLHTNSLHTNRTFLLQSDSTNLKMGEAYALLKENGSVYSAYSDSAKGQIDVKYNLGVSYYTLNNITFFCILIPLIY